MKKKHTLKVIVLSMWLIFILTSFGLADIVYLKDGSILRGEIIEETNESITIESKDYWKIIQRTDIQKIVREAKKDKELVITQAPSMGITLLAGVGILFLILLLVAIL